MRLPRSARHGSSRCGGLLRVLFLPIEGRLARVVGTPAIYAIAVSAIGASIYVTLGIVAERALGLTPLAYIAAGVFFVVTMLTYVEANSLHPERGGASTFARYAFDELWSFIAGLGHHPRLPDRDGAVRVRGPRLPGGVLGPRGRQRASST